MGGPRPDPIRPSTGNPRSRRPSVQPDPAGCRLPHHGSDRPTGDHGETGWPQPGNRQIGSDQVQAIRAHVARVSSPTPPAADSHTMDLTVRPVITERRAGLNLVTVAYYFGAFMILLAYTFFLGLQWEDLGRGGQALAACGTVASLWLVGRLLRGRGYPLAGNLLIFAGTGVTALAVYSVLRLVDVWPESAEAGAYRDFYH